jgi:hypothetical protein
LLLLSGLTNPYVLISKLKYVLELCIKWHKHNVYYIHTRKLGIHRTLIKLNALKIVNISNFIELVQLYSPFLCVVLRVLTNTCCCVAITTNEMLNTSLTPCCGLNASIKVLIIGVLITCLVPVLKGWASKKWLSDEQSPHDEIRVFDRVLEGIG